MTTGSGGASPAREETEVAHPALGPLRALGFELRETHISWVFIGQHDVYKIKKPIDLGFLDFTTLQRRHDACMREVELNRLLAPDVYIGVVPVTEERPGIQRLNGTGPVVDWAVRMRRLPDSHRADTLLRSGRLHWADLKRLAHRLAEFHASCTTNEEIRSYGSVESIRFNVGENFSQTTNLPDALLSEAERASIEAQQTTFLDRYEDLLTQRIADGRVRDGHGDLRLEHVYIDPHDGRIRVLDCIEFNDRFRYGDVCSDIAFLAMDLAWSGRVDLAERFIAEYAQITNDFELYRLIDFYESYRAFVRGKVAAIALTGSSVRGTARTRLEREARRFFLLSLAAERPPISPPRLVAVGGLIAAGKSTVARELAETLSCPVIRSDAVRKHLAGVNPTDSLASEPFDGAYDPETTNQVYDRVAKSVDAVLSSGRTAIADASFQTRAHRRQMRKLAQRLRVPFLFIECRASRDLVRQRLADRADAPSVSDGSLDVMDDFAARYEPIDELSSEEHLVVDTQRPMSELLDRIETFLLGSE